MAIVSDIVTNIKAVAAAQLGGNYKELIYFYDVSKNDERTGRLGYAVRPLNADTAPTVTRTYTLDHEFELILADTFARGGVGDAEKQTALLTMYDQADEIFKDMVNTHLSLPTTVLNVYSPRLSEPEFFEASKLVVLRMQFTVKYRSNL